MTTTRLPKYVEGGGRHQIWRPPYRAKKAKLLGMVLRADQARIDRLLDRDFNDPAGGAVDYRCAHQNIIVTLASIEELSCADPPDCERGFGRELELSIWCLVADQTADERLVWYLPYVFTDSGQTACTGREVYGFPKQVGGFDPLFGTIFTSSDATTTITSLAVDKFGERAQITPLPMASITREGGTGAGPLALAATWVRELIDNMFPGGFRLDVDVPVCAAPAPSAVITAGAGTIAPPPGPTPPPPYLKPIIRAIRGTGLSSSPDALVAALVASQTLVFLKQFRDVRHPSRACYQAIVEARISVDPLSVTVQPLDPTLFGVTVWDWDSHPIASELGLPIEMLLVPERVFQASVDFDVETGLEVWRAPT